MIGFGFNCNVLEFRVALVLVLRWQFQLHLDFFFVTTQVQTLYPPFLQVYKFWFFWFDREVEEVECLVFVSGNSKSWYFLLSNRHSFSQCNQCSGFGYSIDFQLQICNVSISKSSFCSGSALAIPTLFAKSFLSCSIATSKMALFLVQLSLITLYSMFWSWEYGFVDWFW